MNTLVGEVFVVMFGDTVLDVYTSQYLADEVVAKINKTAMEKNDPKRAYAVCRDLYTF